MELHVLELHTLTLAAPCALEQHLRGGGGGGWGVVGAHDELSLQTNRNIK